MVKLSDHRELIVVLVALGLLAAYIIIPALPTRAQSTILVASDLGSGWVQIQYPTKPLARYNDTDIDSESFSEMALPAYSGRVHVVIQLIVFKSQDQAIDELNKHAEYCTQSQGYNLTWTDMGDAAFYNISSADRDWSIFEFRKGDMLVFITLYGPTNAYSNESADYYSFIYLRTIAGSQAQKI